jgi:hypothetical protein
MIGNLAGWVAHMWSVMGHTGNGYHRPSLKHTGEYLDRRNDKLREVASIDEEGKPEIVFVERSETKIQRKFRTAIPVYMRTRGRK